MTKSVLLRSILISFFLLGFFLFFPKAAFASYACISGPGIPDCMISGDTGVWAPPGWAGLQLRDESLSGSCGHIFVDGADAGGTWTIPPNGTHTLSGWCNGSDGGHFASVIVHIGSPPNCNINPSCSGPCTAPPNTCSNNNGIQACVYTAYSGGGSCTRVAAPSQACTINNCSGGYVCVAGSCVALIPPVTVSGCSANPSSASVYQTINFSPGSVSGGTGSYGYSWNFGDSTSSSLSNPTHQYTSAGSRNVVVTVSSPGASSGSCSVPVNVSNLNPTCNANGANPSTATVGQAVSFLVNINGNPALYTFNWSDSEGPIGTGTNPTKTYSSTGSKSPIVRIYSGATLIDSCSVGLTVIAAGNAICYNNTPRLQGLLSTPDFQTHGRFGNSNGRCVVNAIPGSPEAEPGIVSFKIPTYDDLKNLYYQRKTSTTGPGAIDKQILTGDQPSLDLRGGNGDKLFNITGDLSLTTCPDSPGPPCSGNRSAVVFIEGNLNIGDKNAAFNNNRLPLDIRYDNPNAGIVYIVRGNVNFGRNVHSFDGLIIAQGTICTSVDAGGLCLEDRHFDSDPGGETKQLIVNGNLVSLDSNRPINFMRNLIFSTVAFPNGNDCPTCAAEIINVRPKFFVVMRNLLSETLSIQTEDTHYAINQ